MITDDEHPLMLKAAQDLAFILSRCLMDRIVSEGVMVFINNVTVEHRKRWRSRNVDFPVMSALVIPRLGHIDLVRADIDSKHLPTVAANLAVKCPLATAGELRQAMAWAFPDFRPGHAVLLQ